MILFRMLRRLVIFGLVLLLLVLGAAWVWYQYEKHRDPMGLLDRGSASFRVLSEEELPITTLGGEARIFHNVSLDTGPTGIAQFTVSLPDHTTGKLPTIVVLGGLEIGRDSLGYIAQHGRNALVAFQYPRSQERWYEGSPLKKLPAIRRAALDVPGQVDAILAWIAAQPWADEGRVSLLGYSFGAIFLPSIQHLAQVHGRRLGPTVMAYGGADIPSLLAANLNLRPRWLRTFLTEALAISVRPLEPSLHLPYLQGEFLFINGKRDAMVPPANALLMQSLVQAPKKVVWLDSAHMNPGNPALLAEIIRISREWLLQHKAMNP
jgi:hypothetical protein